MSQSFEERVSILEKGILDLTALVFILSLAVKDHLNQEESIEGTFSEVSDEVPPVYLPAGYLDCEAFVKGRIGHVDMAIANQFGQACARAAKAGDIEPIKIDSPGEHWTQVNTWPIEFLRDIWFLTYGGA